MHVEGEKTLQIDYHPILGRVAILLFSYRNDTEMGIGLQIDKI